MGSRVFVLSPARLDGVRAKAVLEGRSKTALAAAVRTVEGAPIGELFQQLSGLYFRGKLAYARRFARPPIADGWMGSGALVMTANRGLVPVEARVSIAHLEAFAEVDIARDTAVFQRPLARDARRLAGDVDEVVLLGSVASKKYVEPLLAIFGARLLFPADFVGRGDLSRGGLLLRAVEAGAELAYAPVEGAPRHGPRPPRLEPRKR